MGICTPPQIGTNQLFSSWKCMQIDTNQRFSVRKCLQIGTNHFGHHYLTQLLLPTMKASVSGSTAQHSTAQRDT